MIFLLKWEHAFFCLDNGKQLMAQFKGQNLDCQHLSFSHCRTGLKIHNFEENDRSQHLALTAVVHLESNLKTEKKANDILLPQPCH